MAFDAWREATSGYGTRTSASLVPLAPRRMLPSRQRLAQILTLALPIIGGMISQNVLNLVDTAMVGTLGDAALAATNLGGFANWLSMAFITGLATGVQSTAARRNGEGQVKEQAIPLNGGLLQAIALALPMSALIFVFTPDLFPLLIDDPAVVELGVPYLRTRLCAMVFVAMNFAFRGYFNGVNLSRLYMGTLVVMHVSNIVLNWVFIFGNLGAPALGVQGAGLASALSAALGTLTYFALAWRHARPCGFLRRVPEASTFVTMARLAVPSGIQQLFFAGGMMAFSIIVGLIGTAELAATGVIINLLLVAVLPALGYGLAATSLVGQALGRKDKEDAARWGWDVSKVAALTVFLISIPGIVAPELLLSLFLRDPETLELAKLPLRIIACGVWMDGIGMVLLNAHFGAGDAKTVMIVSIVTQWFVLLPVAYLVGPVLGGGIVAIWLAQAGYRALQAGVFSYRWARGGWVREV